MNTSIRNNDRMLDVDTKRELMLKTPQSIIHIRHQISLQQYKYWILMLIAFKEQDGKLREENSDFYYIPRSTIEERFGYFPDKRVIWEDLKALKNETISMNTLNKDGQKEKKGAGFITEWSVTNSYIRFKLPTFLENEVRKLGTPDMIFSLLNWNIFNDFDGKHEAVIYKLCRDYAGVKRTPWMTIHEFRNYMGVSDKYGDFKSLNNFVIRCPTNIINESNVSDILVEPEYQREGRKVVALRFNIKMKLHETEQTPDPTSEITDVEFKDTAFEQSHCPIAPSLQIKYREQRTDDEIRMCIDEANKYGDRQERIGKTVNYGALYRKAIEVGWHEGALKKNLRVQHQREAKEQSEREKIQKEQKDNQQNAVRSSNRDRNYAWFSQLPEPKQRELVHEFVSTQPKVDVDRFKKLGAKIAPFTLFLSEKYKNSSGTGNCIST